MKDVFYRIIGEKRRFGKSEPIIIDNKMDLEEAERMIEELEKDHALWKFWIEEDDVSESVCSKPELSI